MTEYRADSHSKNQIAFAHYLPGDILPVLIKPYESYTSSHIDTKGLKPHRIHWDADVPKSTQLKFQIRGAASEVELEDASWIKAEGESTYYEKSGQEINDIPSTAKWLQYRAYFISKDGCRSAQLKEVSIEFSDKLSPDER